MRRILPVVLCIAVIFCLAGSAAANSASGGSFSALVAADGSCQITLDLQLQLVSPSKDLSFPLPSAARGITVNGSAARTSRSGDVLLVKLGSLVGNATGTFTLRLQYTIPNVVRYDSSGDLLLRLPILSGFSCPIHGLSIQITLPGEIALEPAFYSGYYQQTIESSMHFAVSGSSIDASFTEELKDRETLEMVLTVSEEMFPQDPIALWSIGIPEVLMIVFALLAALYWGFFLRCAPILRQRSTAAPEGFSAGQLQGMLGGCGCDLTMMVFSWAQMGYLLIHLQDSGRVTLHKRMDMGNERSAYEVRVFRSLFGKRSFLDGTGYHYATLCKKCAAVGVESRDMYRRDSGNPRVFRALCAMIGLMGGISLGQAIVGDALLGVLLIAVLAVLGILSAWSIQGWVRGLHLRDRRAVLSALIQTALWLLLGSLAGIGNVTVWVVLAQLLGGLGFAYGGRRTVIGRQNLSQMLGLRHYLKKLPPEQAHRISRSDPEYFFSMAPYAMALGVGKAFAHSFRGKRLPGCPYLTTGMDGHMTAPEWLRVMERAADILDARQRRLFLERLMNK